MPSAGVRLRRTWRRIGERGSWLQVGVAVLAVVVVGAVVVAVVAAAGGGDDGEQSARTTQPARTIAEVPRDTAGVTDTSITVVFPVIDLGAAGQAVGLQGLSDEKDPTGIRTYVRAINDAGGINGRKLEARIEKFNPLEPSEMRAKCKDWTTSGEVFAVVDTGKWYDDQQLCITEEGGLPLISSWTTVTDWTERGAPYLWWNGPDQADVLRNLVPWGIEHGLLGPDTKFAILAGDRAGDRLAVDEYLLPALAQQGLEPTLVDTITANLDDPATAQSQARSAVTRLESEGVETVIPLLPVNAFRAYLTAAKSQGYAPDLMLSDYEGTVNVALGLAEFQFPDLLSGQLGPTVYTLSSEDDDRPDNGLTGPGYTPQAKACWETYRAQHDKPPYIEAQGPTMRWCDAINILAKGIELAGPRLDRRSFLEGLSKIKDLPVALTESITFGPDDHAGPNSYRTVRPVKNGNSADTNLCPPRRTTPDDDNPFHGSCWQLVEDFRPLQSS
jgi:ABC-type branched-subunit amino acid transport system substrate-binding protein